MTTPASPEIIQHVTNALIKVVESGFDPALTTGTVGAKPPDLIASMTTGEAISLYLYRVVESPDLKNQGPYYETIAGEPGQVRVRRDPLALNLHYLLIPYANESSYLETYSFLGHAMKALHDNAIVTLGDWGVPGLSAGETALEVRVTPEPLTTSELAQIWEAVHQPYRLSVSYVVRTVQIASNDVEDVRRVTERRLHVEQTAT